MKLQAKDLWAGLMVLGTTTIYLGLALSLVYPERLFTVMIIFVGMIVTFVGCVGLARMIYRTNVRKPKHRKNVKKESR